MLLRPSFVHVNGSTSMCTRDTIDLSSPTCAYTFNQINYSTCVVHVVNLELQLIFPSSYTVSCFIFGSFQVLLNFGTNFVSSGLNSVFFLLKSCHQLPPNYFQHSQEWLVPRFFDPSIECLRKIIQKHITFGLCRNAMSRPGRRVDIIKILIGTSIHTLYDFHVMLKNPCICCSYSSPQLIFKCYSLVSLLLEVCM
jgi:hypothetical protein